MDGLEWTAERLGLAKEHFLDEGHAQGITSLDELTTLAIENIAHVMAHKGQADDPDGVAPIAEAILRRPRASRAKTSKNLDKPEPMFFEERQVLRGQ